MKTIGIDDDSRNNLYSSFESVCKNSSLKDFYERALALEKSFIEHCFSAWKDLKNHCAWPSETGFLLIKNLPVDKDLSPTPNNDNKTLNSMDSETIVSASISAISIVVGVPTAYIGEGEGEFIHNIFPKKKFESTQSNQGSLQELRFHNDITYDSKNFYISNPDYLVLFCLRNPQAARTCYIESHEIIGLLDEVTKEILRKPIFRMSAPYNYSQKAGSEVRSEPMPVLVGPDGSPELRFTASGVIPLTEEASLALNSLENAIKSFSDFSSVILQPGDALVINNRKGLHYRENFVPQYDGNDRWLKRCYVRRDLWALRHLSTRDKGVFNQQ